MQPPGLSAVRAQGLGRRFGKHWALAHVDLEIRSGEGILLAGANGSGKTTLLRLFAGLLRRSAGELSIFDLDPTAKRRDNRRYLTLVSHDNYLYDRLTAIETLRVWSRLLGRDTRDETLMALLERVDLQEAHATRTSAFSAGMRKRLTLLRAHLEEPWLVLMDEPFAALDPPGQALIERWIRDFLARGVTVVLASHALQRAAALCDRAFVLRRGQVVWTGPASRLDHEALHAPLSEVAAS